MRVPRHGTYTSVRRLPGEELPGVYEALRYLLSTSGTSWGSPALPLAHQPARQARDGAGGGDTAWTATRTAIRQGGSP